MSRDHFNSQQHQFPSTKLGKSCNSVWGRLRVKLDTHRTRDVAGNQVQSFNVC